MVLSGLIKESIMSISEQVTAVNYLLQGLPVILRKEFIAACEPVALDFGRWLYEPGQPLDYAYFPLTGFISLLNTINPQHPLELGLIGNEGMLGATLILGVNSMPLGALVQGDGTALRIHHKKLSQLVQHSKPLQIQLNCYLYVVIAQLAQSAACIHFHDIEQRLARWLLMTHDRAHANHFHLTQEFLADMLGVRRSSVTTAANSFQARRIIHYRRGNIQILNREGLESLCCVCYEIEKQSYTSIFKKNK
jgi:CRP-like cAMP-binding protein